MPTKGYRGFSPHFMKEADRVIEPIQFLASSSQAAPVETITVKKIDGTLIITGVNLLEVSTGLTQGAANTCAIEVGPPGNGSKTFANSSFA